MSNAVNIKAYKKYISKTQDLTKTVIVSTASPYKFSKDVLKSLNVECDNLDEFEIIDELSSKTDTDVPTPIMKLKNAKIIHKNHCEKSQIINAIKNILKV